MARGWVEQDIPSPGRIWLGWAVGAGGVAVLVLGAWLLAEAWRPSLPDPVAIHWGAAGAADGTASLDGTVAVTTGLGLAGLGLLLVVAVALHRQPRLLRGWMAGLVPVVALAPASLLLTLLPNIGAPSWEAARVSGWHLALIVLLPIGAGVLAWYAAARPARLLTVGPTVPPDAPVSIGHEPVRQRLVMRSLFWVAAAVLAGIGALALSFGPSLLLYGAVIAAPMAWLAVYRYDVTDSGVVVTFGPIGPLRRTVPVAEIEGAETTSLRPADWGGWGYRTNGRDWAVVTRSGPGARIALAGRRGLSLTSDDPQALAGRVNAAVLRFWGG